MTPRISLSLRTVFLTLFLVACAAVMLNPSTALAHNEYVESTPAEGDVLSAAPTTWDIMFTKEVPLETASGEVVNSNGVRTSLRVPTHGSNTNVIRFAMPPDLIGSVTARWKLVSEDGHVVQGRVNFTITTSAIASDSLTSDTQLGTSPVTPIDDVSDVANTTSVITNPAPEPVRWAVRSMGFAAVMMMGGLIFVERALSMSVLGSARGLRIARVGSISLAAVPFLQNLFLVGDIQNKNVISSLPHFFSSFDLTYGAMLITQTLIGLAVTYVVLTSARQFVTPVTQQLLIALFVMYLITLAFSGHSRTMVWPVLGVPADVVHTGAAAMWLGGLATLAFLVVPSAPLAQSVSVYRQFGFFARYAVIAIVVTGVIQTLRLHGDIVSLFTETHGRILLLKIATVAAMLKVADINRRRLVRRLHPDAHITEKRINLLWRASVTEIATGGIVIAITAALVTSSFN